MHNIFSLEWPGMNITRALSSEGIFSYSSLHQRCCLENSLRSQPHMSLYAFFFTTYLSVRIFVYRWWTFSFREKNQNYKGLLYFLSKMRQFSVKYLSARVKLFRVFILSVSSSNFSLSLQSEPKVNLSLEVALSLFSSFTVNGFIPVI